MTYSGYCWDCDYEGKFLEREQCPKCKSSNIDIYEENIDDDYGDDD